MGVYRARGSARCAAHALDDAIESGLPRRESSDAEAVVEAEEEKSERARSERGSALRERRRRHRRDAAETALGSMGKSARRKSSRQRSG